MTFVLNRFTEFLKIKNLRFLSYSKIVSPALLRNNTFLEKMVYYIDEFAQNLSHHLGSRNLDSSVIEALTCQNGGWEKWLQGEILICLYNRNPPDFSMQQEANIYIFAPQQKADFLFISQNFANPLGIDDTSATLCELKCVTPIETENAFSNRIDTDIVKLHSRTTINDIQGNPIRDHNVLRLMIAVGRDKEMFNYTEQLQQRFAEERQVDLRYLATEFVYGGGLTIVFYAFKPNFPFAKKA